MKRIAFMLFSLLPMALISQSPLVKQWDKRYGGIGLDRFSMVEHTRDGGYILGGSSSSGNTGDKSQPGWGSWDYWVVRLDSSGNKLWDKRFGGSSMDEFAALTLTKDGGFLLAGTSSSPISGDKTQNTSGATDFWVVKIDSFGIKEWDKRYGGNKRDNLSCVISQADGGFILGGSTLSDVGGDISSPNRDSTLQSADYWIVKIDSAGNRQWDKRYGGLKNEQLNSLQQTNDGGFVLGGKSVSGIGGDKSVANWGSSYDFWIIKIDSLGVKQWDKRYGTISVEFYMKMIQTRDSGYIVIGQSPGGVNGDKSDTSRGMYDYWVIKLDPSGNKQWDKTYGSSNREEALNVIETKEGDYLISGDSYSPAGGEKTENNLGYQCIWLIKIDTIGNIVWDKTIQTYGENDAGCAIQNNDGSIVMVDCNNGEIGGEKTYAGWDSVTPLPMMLYDTDYWIIKYKDTTQYCNSGMVNITADSSFICSGDSINLCAPPQFTSYVWNNGVTTACFYAKNAGNYYVTVTDSNSCTAESNHISVSVYTAPQVSVSQRNDTLTVYSATGCQWYLNGVPIIGATQNVYVVTEPGSYYVITSDSNGCTAISSTLLLTGINDIERNKFCVIPNPFTSDISVSYSGQYAINNATISVTNLTGQIVYSETTSNINILTPHNLNLSCLQQGAYFLCIESAQGMYLHKVIKQ